LYASGDSITSARLEAMWPRALRLDGAVRDPNALHMLMLERVYRRAGDFDFLHCHLDYYPFSLFCRQSTPFVTTLHGRLDLPEHQPVFETFSDIPVISISNAQRRPLPQAHWVRTIHHGLPERLLMPQPAKPSYFAFLGRIAPEKGVAMLLGSVAILAARGVNPPLRVIGGGGEDAGLRALAASLGLDVEFAGALRPEAVGAAMRRCAVLAVPSVREGLGLVALEGMAAGAIVVATRVGGLVETVVDGVTGVLAEPGDASAFADALGRGLAIAAAPDARAAMTSAARRAAATHAIDRSVDATINLYRGLRHQVLPR